MPPASGAGGAFAGGQGLRGEGKSGQGVGRQTKRAREIFEVEVVGSLQRKKNPRWSTRIQQYSKLAVKLNCFFQAPGPLQSSVWSTPCVRSTPPTCGPLRHTPHPRTPTHIYYKPASRRTSKPPVSLTSGGGARDQMIGPAASVISKRERGSERKREREGVEGGMVEGRGVNGGWRGRGEQGERGGETNVWRPLESFW